MSYVFSAKEYRPFLRQWIDSQVSARGLLTKMSEAMGCQNSHLSRVLREDVHLTLEQAFEASQFIKMTESETNYFMKMVEFERAGNLNYKKKIGSELESMRAAHSNLSKRYKQNRIGRLEKEMVYYSSWYWSAIHILTAIPKYQTAKSIAQRLSMDELFINNCLETLAGFGLIKPVGEHWEITSEFIHLPKESPMNSIQHGNWRTKAVTSSQNVKDESLHYTMIQAVSIDDFARIKQLLLETIDAYRKISDQSPSEELICFTFDFFKV